ncbi:MAG: SURF1 family protein [Pseudomonadota bacterium]
MDKMPRFRPTLISSIAVAILLPVFLYLGYWQLQRADEKRLLQTEYDTRAHKTLIKVEPRLQRVEELQFYKVVARGRYETGHQILLDNRVQQGQVGYQVITPLRLENSDVRILVNRGWIPLGTDRAHLPVIATPEGSQEVAGLATLPAEKFFTLGQPEKSSQQWQTVWQNLDMRRYIAAVPYPVQPVIILLDPESPAGGFVREWGRLDTGIAVHQGYAFQWFMLAATLMIVYLFYGLRAGRVDGANNEDS